MTDPKRLAVRYLRDLARRHLGPGYSNLKTRGELLAALLRVVPELVAGNDAGGEPMTAATGEDGQSPPVDDVEPGAQVSSVAVEERPSSSAPMPQQAEPSAAATPAPRDSEPLVEGFFVARVSGPDEARRHHLAAHDALRAVHSAQACPLAGPLDRLGALPSAYGDDAVFILGLDPHTLFVSWDIRRETLETAGRGLDGPIGVLRVFDLDTLVREVEFNFGSAGYYLQSLVPGRLYCVSAHLVGRNGVSRQVGRDSNRVRLPSLGPSEDRSVRFLHVPWNVPLPKLRTALRQGKLAAAPPPVERPYLTWTRQPLPSSPQLLPPPPSNAPQEATPAQVPDAPFEQPLPTSASVQRTWSSWPSGRR